MKLDELLPWVTRAVRVHAADAPEDMLLGDLGRAATAFMASTKVLTDTIVLDLQAGVTDYLLDECPSEPHRVWYRVEDVCLGALRAEPGPMFGLCDSACMLGAHGVYWDRDTHTVHVRPPPREDMPGGLRLKMITTLDGSPDAALPAFVRTDADFFDGLVAAAAARALEDLNAQAAALHRAKAERALTKIIAARLHGWGGAQARMTARGFISR